MAIKIFDVKYSELKQKDTLRLWVPFELPKIKYKYDKFINSIESCETGSRPSGGITEEFIGEAISLGGEQIGTNGDLDLANIPYISFDYYNSATKGKIKNNDILICKDGALTGKTCFVDDSSLPSKEVMINEHVFTVRCNSKYIQKVLFYIIRSEVVQSQIKDFAFKKKAQPGLSQSDFNKIKIPVIPFDEQEKLLNKIIPLEEEIKQLKEKTIDEKEVINSVFQQVFEFNYKTFENLKDSKIFNVSFSNFNSENDLRFSSKFHRPASKFVYEELTKIPNKRIMDFAAEPLALGSSVSPNDFEEDTELYYVSMATIGTWYFRKDKADNLSPSYFVANNHKSVRKNDIILVRSGEGAIGKVALIEEDIGGIFADFTIRIRLNNYNQKFAYYYFRTDYFQYLVETYKKGLGNNTNIFPSVLQEFPIPDISISEQNEIVFKIDKVLEQQKKNMEKIELLRKEIIEIINKFLF